MSAHKQIHLGLWLTYQDISRWRDAGSRAEEITRLEPYAELAEIAEDARLDAVFRGDGVGFNVPPRRDQPVHASLEILTLLAALAARTTKVGLIGTASTSFSEPYNLARTFATLDHLSNGRAGWNIVTSSGGEQNYGTAELPPQEQRYERADEFITVVSKLWASWEKDSLPIDKATGTFVVPEKIHPVNHHGKHFSVSDPLNVPRSPQGRPVFVQAGNSEPGQAFAARHAEIVFTAQSDLRKAQEFYRGIKERVRANGRDPESVKVLPALGLHIAKTETEVRDRRQEFLDGLDYEASRRSLENLLGDIDLSDIDLDDQVPADRWPNAAQLVRRQSRPQIFIDLGKERGFTLRQILQEVATGYGHGTVFGTAEKAADRIQQWVEHGAADGFVLSAWYGLPSARLIAEEVVPMLQDRGLFRREYEGSTLRDHFGLPPL